jgi:hypothetical protein
MLNRKCLIWICADNPLVGVLHLAVTFRYRPQSLLLKPDHPRRLCHLLHLAT